MTASLPLPGLSTLEAPAAPRVTPARRADLVALRVGDAVVVTMGARVPWIERVTRDASAPTSRTVQTMGKSGDVTTWSLKDGRGLTGYRECSIRPAKPYDVARIGALQAVEDAERASGSARRAVETGARQIESHRRTLARWEHEQIEADSEARIAAAALSDARARLARIDEEGGT